MSAAVAAPPKPKKTVTVAEAEAALRSEAVAIEKLRKQIEEAGKKAGKEAITDFAKRQKAYLDRKIEFEKQKRAGGPITLELPVEATAIKPEPTKPVEKKVEPVKPVEKKAEPAKPEPTTPVAKTPEPTKKTEPAPASKPEKSPTEKPAETAASPAKKGGFARVFWGIVITALAVAAYLIFKTSGGE